MANEVEKAQTAQPEGDTIFAKIIRGDIPTDFLYKDDEVDSCYFCLHYNIFGSVWSLKISHHKRQFIFLWYQRKPLLLS